MAISIRKLLVYGLNGTLLAILFGLIAITVVDQWKKHQCECPVTERLERLKELKTTLRSEIFGQHIAIEAILIALEAHITNPNPAKALVLCLHGTVGTGKTRVSQLIENSLFGKSSSKVVRFFGPHDFIPDVSKLVENQEKVKRKVVETAKNCKQSLFIFDEVDKMKPNILNKIIHFIDHHEPVNGIDYRSSIFMFISNTGGKEINDYMAKILREGKFRTDASLDQFTKIIEKAAYSTDDGGFYQSALITKKLVNYYIPFLPLQKRHVEQCAAQQIKLKKLQFLKPEEVSNLLNFDEAGFSEDGCKNVAPQVDFLGIKLKQKYYEA